MAAGMISDKERKDAAKNFNTNLQNESVTERFFIAMMYITKGEHIDIKGIAKLVNKKSQSITPIDADNLELLLAVSQHSADAFEQMVYKLGCSQAREQLMEMYYLLT